MQTRLGLDRLRNFPSLVRARRTWVLIPPFPVSYVSYFRVSVCKTSIRNTFPGLFYSRAITSLSLDISCLYTRLAP